MTRRDRHIVVVQRLSGLGTRLAKAGTPPVLFRLAHWSGHRSLYTEMLPLAVRYHVPVTVFIYPSAISRADYASTWEQLSALQRTGLFDIQSHTYWHPNFKKEKRRLAPRAYEEFVTAQLTKSRDQLQEQLGVRVDMLAWRTGRVSHSHRVHCAKTELVTARPGGSVHEAPLAARVPARLPMSDTAASRATFSWLAVYCR